VSRSSVTARSRTVQVSAIVTLPHSPAEDFSRAGDEDYSDPRVRRSARIRIDEQWYDASGWAQAHPGGARWIHWFDGRDATGIFYALHSYGPNGSALAAERLAKLPKCDAPGTAEQRLPKAQEYEDHLEFQQLRVELEEQGYWKREPLKEAWALAQVVGLYVAGTALAWEQPIVATVLLGLGMQQAGWLAHDYVHGRGAWCESMRWFGAITNGHSASWWSQKHSLHHSFTNEEKHDNDIMMEPFFYLRHPKESGRTDSPVRFMQHVYAYPLLSIIYYLWRYFSIMSAYRRKDMVEGGLLLVNYTWLAFCMPHSVAIGSIFLSGLLVGGLVSATHQSEEIMAEGDEPDFVTGQFRSTRDAEAVFGPLETWLWGGMDTQLEHHLFPTMPRYNYHKLRPVLKKWALERNINYRISPSTTILSDNYNLMKDVAAMP